MSGDQAAETAQPSAGQWARDLADTYERIAEAEIWEPRRNANLAEAAKYRGIADRMDRMDRARRAGQDRP